MNVRTALAIGALAPALLSAQVRPTAPVIGALVKKSIPRANITAVSGSSISTVPTYDGIQCPEGCIVARGGSGGNSSLSVRFADGSVRVEEVRAGLVLSHDKPHAIKVSMDDWELAGIQCNAKGGLKATPNFRGLGATNTGFKWAIFEGAKMLKSGHSNGEPVEWNGDGHSKGPMQLAVFSDATVEIGHDGARLVMTSDDSEAIQARTGGSLRFSNLGIAVSGPSEFALTSAQLQGTNK